MKQQAVLTFLTNLSVCTVQKFSQKSRAENDYTFFWHACGQWLEYRLGAKRLYPSYIHHIQTKDIQLLPGDDLTAVPYPCCEKQIKFMCMFKTVYKFKANIQVQIFRSNLIDYHMEKPSLIFQVCLIFYVHLVVVVVLHFVLMLKRSQNQLKKKIAQRKKCGSEDVKVVEGELQELRDLYREWQLVARTGCVCAECCNSHCHRASPSTIQYSTPVIERLILGPCDRTCLVLRRIDWRVQACISACHLSKSVFKYFY